MGEATGKPNNLEVGRHLQIHMRIYEYVLRIPEGKTTPLLSENLCLKGGLLVMSLGFTALSYPSRALQADRLLMILRTAMVSP